MMSVINNASVRNGNADLVLPVCDGGYLRDLIEPKPRYFNLTEKEEEKANETR